MSECAAKTCSRGTIFADSRAFSLVELIVVMGIFLTVMLISASAFKIIANSSSQQSKSIETQIEGIVGLEVLRADLQQAGFGLPWAFSTPISYLEADVVSTLPAPFWPSGLSANSFNDATTRAPRAIQSSETTFNIDSDNHGSKFIVIKSMTATTNDTSKKWTNVSYAAGARASKSWGDASRDFAANDRVVVVKNNLITTPPSRQLKVNSGNFYATLTALPFIEYTALMTNHLDGDTYQVYGVAPGNPRMPFNRADYFIMTPATANTMPQGCAPNTGVLYKYNISQSFGGYNPMIPLVDCVADMQIVYGLDSNGDGTIDSHISTSDPDFASTFNYDAVLNPDPAQTIRNKLKEIRVYILAQDGKQDTSFKYPSQTIDVGESFDGTTNIKGRKFDLRTLIGSGWQNYRWKVYTIVVRPLNLIQ